MDSPLTVRLLVETSAKPVTTFQFQVSYIVKCVYVLHRKCYVVLGQFGLAVLNTFHSLQLRLICNLPLKKKKSSHRKVIFVHMLRIFFAMTRVKISTKVWGMDT